MSNGKIALILTPGFADWEYALMGGTGGPFYGLDIQYFAPAAGELRSQGGLTVVISQSLDALSPWQPNAVVVVGGTIWETEGAPDVAKLLNAQRKNGSVVAGICGGTLALARAGLLNEVPHTSNDVGFLTENAENYSGHGHYRANASAVAEDRVITAAGTAPVSFTAAVFELVGIEQAAVQQFKSMMAAEHSPLPNGG